MLQFITVSLRQQLFLSVFSLRHCSTKNSLFSNRNSILDFLPLEARIHIYASVHIRQDRTISAWQQNGLHYRDLPASQRKGCKYLHRFSVWIQHMPRHWAVTEAVVVYNFRCE